MSDYRHALVYAADMRRRGLYGGDLKTPYQRTCGLFGWIRQAGLRLREDHHGSFPWYSFVHHITSVKAAPTEYHARAFTLGVYTRDLYYQYAAAGKMTADLPGAVVISHANVSAESLSEAPHGHTFTMPFDHFNAHRIPREGVWVVVTYDVDQPDEAPEITANEYAISASEMTVVQPGTNVLLPFSMINAHHIGHMHQLGVVSPRVLLRIEGVTGAPDWVQLDGAAMELNLIDGKYTQYTASELGETTLSARIATDTNVDRPTVKSAVSAALKRHRAASADGFYTTADGQHQFGEPGNATRITSPALAVLVMYIGVRSEITRNRDRIIAELEELNPQWRRAGDTEDDAAMRARLSTEAMISGLSPQGRKSPVLAELKRIFGDKGVPVLRDLLSLTATGLPHSAPMDCDLNKALDRVMAAKIDQDLERGQLVSERYMAESLSRVNQPVWDAGKSALALATLVSVMPDNFSATCNAVMQRDLDMRSAALKHAGVPAMQPSADVKWTHTAPGIYVQASLDDVERATRALINGAESTTGNLRFGLPALRATAIKNADGIKAALDKLAEAPDTKFEASALQFCGIAPASKVAFVQSDALASDNQSTKVAFDATKMHEVVCFKDTTHDGRSLVVLIERAAKQSLVLSFTAAADHRTPLVRDAMSAMVSRIGDNAERGAAVVATVTALVERTLAVNAYDDAGVEDGNARLSSSYKANGEKLTVPFMTQLMRTWTNSGKFVPVSGALDGGRLSVAKVDDGKVMLTKESMSVDDTGTHVGGIALDIGDEMIGTSLYHATPAELHFSRGNTNVTVRVIALGSHLYVDEDALPLLTAAQNLATEEARSGSISDALDAHDPFGLRSAPKLVNPAVVNARGPRAELLSNGSPLVLNALGDVNKAGPIQSAQERADLSQYYADDVAVNEWNEL